MSERFEKKLTPDEEERLTQAATEIRKHGGTTASERTIDKPQPTGDAHVDMLLQEADTIINVRQRARRLFSPRFASDALQEFPKPDNSSSFIRLAKIAGATAAGGCLGLAAFGLTVMTGIGFPWSALLIGLSALTGGVYSFIEAKKTHAVKG